MRGVLPVWRVLFLVSLALTGLTVAVPVLAQSETELRSTADYAYGQNMRFRLRASNLGEVQGVTLYFRPHTATDPYAVSIPIEPTNELDVSYTVDLTETRLPPFSTVSYWWELERVDGATFRVPERTVNYVDDQFSWQWLSKADPEGGGVVTIQWTGENPSIGEMGFDVVIESLERLSPYIPLDEVRPFNVFVYPSTADLGSAMRLAGEEWQAGHTYPELGVLLLTVVNDATAGDELASGIGRDLTDLLLYQAYGDNFQNVPQWLRNGLAEAASGGPDARATTLLADAASAGETIAVEQLCDVFPESGSAAELIHAQSGALVREISRQYGPQAVKDLLDASANGATCAGALETVLPVAPRELAAAWNLQADEADPQRGQIGQAIIWVLLVLAGFGLAWLLVWRSGRGQEHHTTGK